MVRTAVHPDDNKPCDFRAFGENVPPPGGSPIMNGAIDGAVMLTHRHEGRHRAA